MKYLYILSKSANGAQLLALLFAIGCSSPADPFKGQEGVPGSDAPTVYVPVLAPIVPSPTVDLLLADENAYRASIGQQPLTQGMSCTLYTIPPSTTLIIGAILTTVGSFQYNGVFNLANGNSSDGNPVVPLVLRQLYVANFLFKCTGTLVVDDSGWHTFTVSSDDGANVYIGGGVALVNVDGVHSITTKSASKYLKYGLISFELDYMDMGGSHALILQEDGQVMSMSNMVH